MERSGQSIPSPISKELRVPPQDVEAEQAILGSVMLKPECINDILDSISPQCFYARKHRIIYETMLELFSKNEAIDLLTLTSRLKDKKLIEKVGGSGYLTELVNTVPSAANVVYYSEIVQKKFLMRNLIDAANEISQLGYSEEEEIGELLDAAEKRIFQVTNLLNASDFVTLSDELSEAFERLEKLHDSGTDLRGISSGYKALDNKLSGFQKSDFVLLAARPSTGKTALALDIARRTATEHGNPVLIFSLEMSSQQLVDRMLAAESRVDAWKLRTGKIRSEKEFSQLRDALDRLSKAPIFIEDTPANNILKMRSIARKLKRDKDLKLIIVDYLQLMIPSGRFRNSDSMVNQVTEISRSLKQLARELEIPVIALSQLSRAVEQRGGKPRLSDLRDSGSLEQDADVVMFIHREDRTRRNEGGKQTNIAEILIEKHRNGPVGKVDLYFDDQKATFMDLETNDFDTFDAEETDNDEF
ncbi:MAG: replicative DNA helicase [Candidatus Paceibacterota bacterium]